jgi:hypothetical protein
VDLAHVGALVSKEDLPLVFLAENGDAAILFEMLAYKFGAEYLFHSPFKERFQLILGFLSEILCVSNASVVLKFHEGVGVGVLRQY